MHYVFLTLYDKKLIIVIFENNSKFEIVFCWGLFNKTCHDMRVEFYNVLSEWNREAGSEFNNVPHICSDNHKTTRRAFLLKYLNIYLIFISDCLSEL